MWLCVLGMLGSNSRVTESFANKISFCNFFSEMFGYARCLMSWSELDLEAGPGTLACNPSYMCVCVWGGG